jgi:outer membrane receptor protein involved in Fe transport
LEIDTAFVTPWGIYGNVSLAWLDAKFTDYANGACPAGTDPPCDQTGTDLPNAPEWSGSVSLNYTMDLPGGNTFTIGGDGQYTGSRFLQADHDPVDVDDSYSVFNARVAFANPDKSWVLQGLVKNVTGRVTNTSSGDIPTQTGAHYALANDPREFEMTLRFRF